MEKPKRYAVIGDDGETCVFLRDTLIQDGHFARAFRLVKNGAGLVFVHQHDTDTRWTDSQLLDWADHVVVVGAEVLAAVATKIPVPAELPVADPQDESFSGGTPGNPFGRTGGSLNASYAEPTPTHAPNAFLAARNREVPTGYHFDEADMDRPYVGLIGNRGGS
jgi:hypothetical protein